VCIDASRPCRPTLEVDARTNEGDLDAGPLMVTVADWGRMVGDRAAAERCLRELKEQGRLTEIMGVLHVTFPTWTTAS
jgi:hypothetical protein